MRLLMKFILISFGLILVGSVPSLFDGIRITFSEYFSTVKHLLVTVFTPWKLGFTFDNTYRPLFPEIWDNYFLTLKILFSAIGIILITGTLLTFLTMLLPKKVISVIKFVLFSLQSLPDLLVAGILQMIVVLIYEATSVLIFEPYAFNGDFPYTLSLLAITIVPTIMLYRMMVLDMEAELNEPYVYLAKSKGLKHTRILSVHMFRNSLFRTFIHSKYIIWFLLSNLLVIEYVFNMKGLFTFTLSYGQPEVLTASLLMIFVPLFVFFTILQVFLEKLTSRKVAL